MIYRTHNLTGCIVALKSKASMRRFLGDRQRSVESKMQLILALQDELEGYTHGTSKGASKLQFVTNSIPNAGAK